MKSDIYVENMKSAFPLTNLRRLLLRSPKTIFLAWLIFMLFLCVGFLYSGDRRAKRPNEVTVTPKSITREEIPKNWIVVTSINPPTEQIVKLAKIPGWKLVVVGDKKTPKNWASPNVIFLDVEAQLKLNYRILEYLPWNAYTRKMIGYLYAIQHGAEFIYDTDDDNAPNDSKTFQNNFIFSPTTRGLIYNDEKHIVANPYVHFGQPSVWPRGFPLEYIGQDYNNSYVACQMKTPVIQQGLVNGDPDVDAIFRLTRKKLDSPLNIQFDSFAPPVIYPKSIMAPFNSQNTVFHYDGFWALALPISVSFRVTDIWRGYWAQPLLWAIGAHLGFYPAHTTQIRNAHEYIQDFDEEDKLYKQGNDLVQLLANWQCPTEAIDLYACMLDLTSVIANHTIWSSNEIEFMEAWIEDLKSIGYNVPRLMLRNTFSEPCLNPATKNFAMFSPNTKSEQEDLYRLPLLKFCNLKLRKTKPSAKSVFPNTLLVVTFNFPHYENIWLLDSIYRPHYPNILYCGDLPHPHILQDLVKKKEFVEAHVNKFSFVNANTTNGYFSYECAMRAIDMGYSVQGFLILSDDILLNFWNNGEFNPNEMWMLNHLKPVSTILPSNSTGWHWWPSFQFPSQIGLDGTRQALAQIYSAGATNPTVDKFRHQREQYGYGQSMAIVAESDIFYFPASKSEILYEVSSILRKCEVFLEIAVPILVSGLSSPENIQHLPGFYLRGFEREYPLGFFNVKSSVIHPVKPSEVISQEKLRNEYCNKYIIQVLDS